MNEGMENLKEIEALKQQLHKEYEAHQKEIALINEDAQITQLRIEKRISELAKEKDIELTNPKEETVILRSKDLRDSDMTSLFEIIQRYVNKQGGELA